MGGTRRSQAQVAPPPPPTTSKPSPSKGEQPPLVADEQATSAWDEDLDLDDAVLTPTEVQPASESACEASEQVTDGVPKANGESAPADNEADSAQASGSSGRTLAPLEAARSVEEAIKAKERLAQEGVKQAMMSIEERRKQLEEQQRKELEKLQQEEVQL